jgi:hypothetical protein
MWRSKFRNVSNRLGMIGRTKQKFTIKYFYKVTLVYALFLISAEWMQTRQWLLTIEYWLLIGSEAWSNTHDVCLHCISCTWRHRGRCGRVGVMWTALDWLCSVGDPTAWPCKTGLERGRKPSLLGRLTALQRTRLCSATTPTDTFDLIHPFRDISRCNTSRDYRTDRLLASSIRIVGWIF